MQRRTFLSTMAAAGATAATASFPSLAEGQAPAAPVKRKGRLKQSLFRDRVRPEHTGPDDVRRTVPARRRVSARTGFNLVGLQDWPTMKKYGLVPTMGPMSFAGLTDGLVRKEQWPEIEKKLREEVDACAGWRVQGHHHVRRPEEGHDIREQGMDLTVEFMNRVKAMLEDKGVTLCMENANSRYPDNVLGRPDQLCDRPSWGFEMCRRVNSPGVKMLLRHLSRANHGRERRATIKENFQLIFHFHCAGVPGRHEIDGTQELNYRFIAQTIVDLGYSGYIAHEYRPTPDAIRLKGSKPECRSWTSD